VDFHDRERPLRGRHVQPGAHREMRARVVACGQRECFGKTVARKLHELTRGKQQTVATFNARLVDALPASVDKDAFLDTLDGPAA
jgi:hypothetical protein